MPRLSQADKETISTWLSSKWTHGKHCPMCHGNEYQLGDFTYMFSDPPEGSIAPGGTPARFHIVPVFCMGCGYTFFVNLGSIR